MRPLPALFASVIALVEFQVAKPGWCALVVEDERGRKAYSDPIWIAAANDAAAAAQGARP